MSGERSISGLRGTPGEQQRVLEGLPERTGALLGPLRRAGEETAGAALTPAGLAEALSGS